MTLKQKLSQYRDIKEEIKKLESKILKLEKTEQNTSDMVDNTTKKFPIVQIKTTIKGVNVDRINKLNKLNKILEERYNKLLEIQLEVEEFINKIPTSRLRMIFEYRYLNSFSWIKIAQLVGGTDESVRKEHDRFLEKK